VAEPPNDDGAAEAGVLVSGYERLREAVLSDNAGGWRLGHRVLCTRGMVGWISTVGSLAPPAEDATTAACVRRPCSTACDEPPSGPAASLPDADQVVAVLMQMVLPLAA
jgi:hypothetical protein